MSNHIHDHHLLEEEVETTSSQVLVQDRDRPAARPYSSFTQRDKWIIVSMIAFAGFFSPLTAYVYLPAIPAISAAFHKSTELMNLTITVYLVLQGVSPMFWGTLSDNMGRRPIFLACLLLLTCSCIGLALVPTSAYWLLMLLRCIQAAGSASTIALGAGVIGDISTPGERGSIYGFFITGPLVGPALGPVIGGSLADKLGWRSIFWFLCISSATCFLFMILFLPETLRALVGEGHIAPSKWYRPLIPILSRNKEATLSGERPPKIPFINPFRLFTYPDIILLFLSNGIFFAAFYAVTTSLATLFHRVYTLSETSIGLCFLAVAGGMLFGGMITGKLLDWDYEKIKNKLAREAEAVERSMSEGLSNEDSFPIEKARLRSMPIYLAIFVACCIGYGWAMHQKVSIIVPLLLHFVFGYTTIAMLNTTQTLLVDLVPSQGSTITACNNLVRSSLGAAMVSVVDIILRTIGVGWTFTLVGGICLLGGPAIYLQTHIGPACRTRRRTRDGAR